jgi:ankyrin repeat protein
MGDADRKQAVLELLEARTNRIQNVDVTVDEGGPTALMWATMHNSVEVVNVLIEKKARLDQTTLVRPPRPTVHLASPG